VAADASLPGAAQPKPILLTNFNVTSRLNLMAAMVTAEMGLTWRVEAGRGKLFAAWRRNCCSKPAQILAFLCF